MTQTQVLVNAGYRALRVTNVKSVTTPDLITLKLNIINNVTVSKGTHTN